MLHERTDALARACRALTEDGRAAAGEVIRSEYPFEPREPSARKYSPTDILTVALRDGFIDRYRGTRLVNPGALRLLSALMPEVFPYHPNWKRDETHQAFWDLFPTIDHVEPVSRGGSDEMSNWVLASMVTNSAKSLWSLDELGWKLLPPGDLTVWDGKSRWLLDFTERDAALERVSSPKDRAYIAKWSRVTRGLLPKQLG